MTSTPNLLDDALMASLAAGESFHGGLFTGTPPDRLRPDGQSLVIGPCPNPDAFPKSPPTSDQFQASSSHG